MTNEPEITLLLDRAHGGDQEALEAVGRAVHADLMRQASRLVRREEGIAGRPMSLEPTELVSETFIKLLRQRTQYKNRQHFFAIATTIMLRVLMDHHKTRTRQKRAGNRIQVSLSGLGPTHAVPAHADIPEFVAAFEELEKLDPRAAQVAKLRVLWGLTAAEVAEVMKVSRSTIDREWRYGRTWLATYLSKSD